MKFFASGLFWASFEKLPERVQAVARKNFELLKTDLKHPSLHFKRVGTYWSVRVGANYRALGVDIEHGILWFWIGTHAQYDRLIK